MELIYNLLRATHSVWMERNNVHHLQAINKVRGLELTKLEMKVDSQFQIGEEGLDEEKHYLLRRNKEELLTSPIETIRSWLCEIYIARGQLDKARLGSLKDRGEILHKIPNLTPTEINRYLDWRNVTLQKRGTGNYN